MINVGLRLDRNVISLSLVNHYLSLINFGSKFKIRYQASLCWAKTLTKTFHHRSILKTIHQMIICNYMRQTYEALELATHTKLYININNNLTICINRITKACTAQIN